MHISIRKCENIPAIQIEVDIQSNLMGLKYIFFQHLTPSITNLKKLVFLPLKPGFAFCFESKKFFLSLRKQKLGKQRQSKFPYRLGYSSNIAQFKVVVNLLEQKTSELGSSLSVEIRPTLSNSLCRGLLTFYTT